MTKAQLVDFSTAKCEIHYEHAYLTGTIIHPELEWHFESDETRNIISQHEMVANGMHVSGNKHYITLRLALSELAVSTPEIEEGPDKIVQGDKYQPVLPLETLMMFLPAMLSSHAGAGKASTLEFGAQVTPEVNSAVTSSTSIVLKDTHDYTQPFIIKAPYGHRLELQLANPDLEIRTITKYNPTWHNIESPLPFCIKEVNLAEAQIASNLPLQVMWITGMEIETIHTFSASGVLYWLTLSQEGRAKLNQQSTTFFNAPLTVRDVTTGITLQVPLSVAIAG